jgi:hypothetical protein
MYAASPLEVVGERLGQLLDGVSDAVRNGATPQHLRVAIRSVRDTIRLLPATLGPRFLFDIELVSQIRQEWEDFGGKLSPAIAPRYANAWSIGRVPMPTDDPHAAHVMRILTFPGADRLSDIDLTEYGWLFHELAHDSFYRVDHRFRESFGDILSARTRTLRLRSAADRGAAARLSDERLKKLDGYWKPRLDQQDWAHEIASDVAALWAIGPAFLTSFMRLLVNHPERALSAADQHPPYLTRALALVLGAQQLGWTDESWGLEEEIALVRRDAAVDASDLIFADEELVEGAVMSALESCAALTIPKMTSQRYLELRSMSETETLRLEGTALVAAATICRARQGAYGYQAWLERVVRA